VVGVKRILWIVIWVWPLLSPAAATLSGKVHPVVPAAAGLAVFLVLYVIVVYRAFNDSARPARYWPFVLLAVLGVVGTALTAGYSGGPSGWLAVMLYVGACGAASLPGRATVPWVAGTVLILVIIGLARHQAASDLGTIAFSTLLASALVFVIRQMSGYIDELRTTRAELATAAVAQERLRFARDLHDLLGHTLSLIVVKAEVVRRLAERDPASAATEAGDIEAIGRRALAEVREAVTGYRSHAFASELDGARTALAGAGVTVHIEQSGTPLPAEADALFGWAVREGVTNVIRHSRARTCRIVVRRSDERAILEIWDDGTGGSTGSGVGLAGSGVGLAGSGVGLAGSGAGLAGSGAGLRGLAERLAASGGTLRAGPAAGGGFRLEAHLPATALAAA
jgi:two-component system, NarL family, sensor histidine kinase DesK